MDFQLEDSQDGRAALAIKNQTNIKDNWEII